jgi:GntR family transcriptional regulator
VIEFWLDAHSGVPAYLQLVQQVRDALRLGRLRAGDQLPTVREVVVSLAINPNTVLKAYRELEHQRIAEGRPGSGTFVVESQPGIRDDDHRVLRRSLERWVQQARERGLDDASVRAIVSSVLQELAREGVA